MDRRNGGNSQAARDPGVEDIGAIAMGMDDIRAQTRTQVAHGGAFPAIGAWRQSDHRVLDGQSIEERMFLGPLAIEYGRHMNTVSTSRLAGCEGQYNALEPAHLPRCNHMYNCHIVVCLQH